MDLGTGGPAGRRARTPDTDWRRKPGRGCLILGGEGGLRRPRCSYPSAVASQLPPSSLQKRLHFPPRTHPREMGPGQSLARERGCTAPRTSSSVFGELEEVGSLFLSMEFYSVVGMWGQITVTLSGSTKLPHTTEVSTWMSKHYWGKGVPIRGFLAVLDLTL